MRMLKRQEKHFVYCLYNGRTEIADTGGFLTGEYRVSYGEKREARGNFSAAAGEATREFFGVSENYERVLLMKNRECPITVNTILWVDRKAETQPHDYMVVGVARSVNHVAYALRRVD